MYQQFLLQDALIVCTCMYKYGASYSERRAVMGTNMTSRLYDTLTGIRINVIQV